MSVREQDIRRTPILRRVRESSRVNVTSHTETFPSIVCAASHRLF
jgi:hypothetical protein